MKTDCTTRGCCPEVKMAHDADVEEFVSKLDAWLMDETGYGPREFSGERHFGSPDHEELDRGYSYSLEMGPDYWASNLPEYLQVEARAAGLYIEPLYSFMLGIWKA